MLKVRALIMDEQYDAAVAEARAAAEAHRGNGAVHEVSICFATLTSGVSSTQHNRTRILLLRKQLCLLGVVHNGRPQSSLRRPCAAAAGAL